jgi:phage terminase small subunit
MNVATKNGAHRLTERQAAFVRAMAAGKTATQAAKDAGYSSAYADRQAAKLVVNPQIRAHLTKLNAEIASPEIADAAERQRWWTSVVRDKAADMKSRLRASELLGKAQGDFIEKQEHSGVVTIRVIRDSKATK